MKKFILIVTLSSMLLMLNPIPLLAAPNPDMFAYGMKIDAGEDNAFYEFELPLEVYKAVTSKDLHDIRVFNSEGSVAPHVIYTPDNRTQEEDAIYADLPFFPITSAMSSSGSNDEISIHIEKNEQGTIVDVKTGTSHDQIGDDQTLAEHKVVSYLIDCGKLKGKPISALELEWSEEQSDFMGNIYVEESSDLNRWQRIATATIARLGYGDYRIDRKKISMHRNGKAYLRISWPREQEAFTLTKVVAFANKTYTVNKPDYRWTKAVVVPVSEKPGHYTIDTGGFLPADRIKIRLKDRNSMAGVRLYSGLSPQINTPVKNTPKKTTLMKNTSQKNKPAEQWRGLVYNFDYQDTTLYNSIINIRETGDRYWLLTVDKSETMPANLPDIEFGWQPHRLTFLARGNGPFQLAYGSVDAPRPDFKVEPLLHEYRQGSKKIKTGRVTLGPQHLLAGIDRLLPAPPALPWKKYILWACLFAGVLAIGWMSVTLYRQLQAETKKNDSDI